VTSARRLTPERPDRERFKFSPNVIDELVDAEAVRVKTEAEEKAA